MEMNPTQHFDDATHELQDKFGPQLEQARQNLSELNRRVTSFIKENPGTCLLGALAVGFVVGKIASRR